MQTINNHHSPLDVLAELRREYDEALRRGARADQLVQIVARMIPLLGQVLGQALHMPATREIADTLNDSLQRWISQLRRDPYFMLVLAAFLHTRISTIEHANDELAEATAAPGRSAEISVRRAQTLAVESVARHVHQQARSLAHVLQQTIDDCDDLALLIPSARVTLTSQYPAEQPAIAHLTAAPNNRGEATARPISPMAQSEPFVGLIRLRTKVCLTRRGKIKHLIHEVGVFHRSLHQDLRVLHLAIDQGAQFGVQDPLVLTNVTMRFAEIAKLAIVTCDQVGEFAVWAAGIAQP